MQAVTPVNLEISLLVWLFMFIRFQLWKTAKFHAVFRF